MALWQAYLEDVIFSFRKQKEWCEQGFNQLGDEEFFRRPGEQSNSVALIVKHLAGNLKSRWTDFLTSDGEKPWRAREPLISSSISRTVSQPGPAVSSFPEATASRNALRNSFD